MKINRQMGLTAFQQYVSPYDITDEKIRIKVEHTYRVADICGQIAKSLSMSQEDIDLAWLTGLLHDVGRFEQVRVYHTFQDASSVDHAAYGADILFCPESVQNTEDLFLKAHPCPDIRHFTPDDAEDALIEKAIRNHNRFMIQEGLTEREQQFCNILRDADKVDILKVNVDSPISEIYNLPMECFEQDEVTAEVMDSFQKGFTVDKTLKKTAIDNVVGHISLVYGMVYRKSLEITAQQGYLDQLLHFPTKNPRTRKQFGQLEEQMKQYMRTCISAVNE